MIEEPNNLACLQHGANSKYIKLHAQTQQELCYYLKHKYGVSKDFNTHSNDQPWYGIGQGASNMCNRWVIQLDSMADAYSFKAHRWQIPTPIPQHQLKQTMKAFINNVNLFIGKPLDASDNTFLKSVQEDINCWHRILCTTGGELNTKKCFWSDLNHCYDKQGTPHI